MILPNKYVTLSESFLGLSGIVLEILSNRFMTIDNLWNVFNKEYIIKKVLKRPPTYQKFIYVIEFMYIVGMISYNEKGEIFNENIETRDIR